MPLPTRAKAGHMLMCAGDEACEVIALERPSAAQTHNLVQLFCAAFSDDPHILWCASAQERRAADLARFFTLLLQARKARILRLGNQGGLLYLPPGSSYTLDERSRIALHLFAVHGLINGILRGLKMTLLEQRQPRAPHYWLQLLAVEPRAQGKGIGSKLLAVLQEHAARSGHPIYLETAREDNRLFYARRGFEMLRCYHLSRGLRLWCMLWRPDSAVSSQGKAE